MKLPGESIHTTSSHLIAVKDNTANHFAVNPANGSSRKDPFTWKRFSAALQPVHQISRNYFE